MPRGGAPTRSSSKNSNQYSALDTNVRSYSDEARNPYYLSNSDHPGLSLVPKILTSCEIYSLWRRAMIVALVARNKLKFVNGKLSFDEDFELWNCCNSTVISWILHAISNEIVESVMYMYDATQILLNLEERFNQ
uniref:Retrotransposon Copia-like N-terminal domain-containing protein n=1 Tax=Cannabis sativa TaxID=3483 RepID=A0A803QHG4_CANSA